MNRSRIFSRGYTIVELMMALAVLAIGVSGIIAMHKVTVASNQHAKNLTIASHIAQAWQEQLAADAVHWNHPSAQNPDRDINDTIWLRSVEGNVEWIRPGWSEALQFGAGFDALGNPVPDDGAAQFCTHVRFAWLYADYTPVAGNGLIRAEVRVFWTRDGRGLADGNSICDPGAVASTISPAIENYHFVYKTSAIRQNTAL